MAKTMTTRLLIIIAAMVAIALSLNSSGREAAAGLPTETPTETPVAATETATPPAATATSTPAAGTATVTPGTATATARLPVAAPQTGGEPGSGSDTLTLALLIGAVTILGVGGVVTGYALGRRII